MRNWQDYWDYDDDGGAGGVQFNRPEAAFATYSDLLLKWSDSYSSIAELQKGLGLEGIVEESAFRRLVTGEAIPGRNLAIHLQAQVPEEVGTYRQVKNIAARVLHDGTTPMVDISSEQRLAAMEEAIAALDSSEPNLMGRMLTIARVYNGLSQKELAMRAALHTRSVAGYECGISPPISTVHKLADALEVSGDTRWSLLEARGKGKTELAITGGGSVFGMLLHHLRDEKDFTLEALGRRVGSSEGGIAGYEHGRSKPGVAMVHKLADALEVSSDTRWLLLETAGRDKAELEAITGGGSVFGMLLYHLREGNGLTQSELERRAGLSRETIGSYEQGRSMPGAAAAHKLADALEVNDDTRRLLLEAADLSPQGWKSIKTLQRDNVTTKAELIAMREELAAGLQAAGMNGREALVWVEENAIGTHREEKGNRKYLHAAPWVIERMQQEASLVSMPPDVREKPGHEMLLRLRESTGMSQMQLAKKANINSASIGNYEQGLARPDVWGLCRISEALNLDHEAHSTLFAALRSGKTEMQAVAGSDSMLGAMVYHLRKDQHLSQGELAKKMQANIWDITKLEKEGTVTDVYVLHRLADALELKPETRWALYYMAGKGEELGMEGMTGGCQTLLGAMLRGMREQNGLSLQDAAERTGVNRGSIHRYERGEYQPGQDKLEQLAEGYGLSGKERFLLFSERHRDVLKSLTRTSEEAFIDAFFDSKKPAAKNESTLGNLREYYKISTQPAKSTQSI